jgi:hypothetical protein
MRMVKVRAAVQVVHHPENMSADPEVETRATESEVETAGSPAAMAQIAATTR